MTEEEFKARVHDPGRLMFWMIISVLLIMISQFANSLFQDRNTVHAVNSTRTVLVRGDCRSKATAALWTDLSDFLVHATAAPGSPDRQLVPTDAVQLKADAKQYKACGN